MLGGGEGRGGRPYPNHSLGQTSFPKFWAIHPQVGEQSHTEIQQPPPGPESYAPPYRPSLEEDSASLSGESLDGHLQGECLASPSPWEEAGVEGWGGLQARAQESAAWNRAGRSGWMGGRRTPWWGRAAGCGWVPWAGGRQPLT